MELLWSTSDTSSSIRSITADFSKYNKFLCFLSSSYSGALVPFLAFSKNQKYGQGGYASNCWFVATFTDTGVTTSSYNGLNGFVQIWGLD